jgi:hypothetical protein
MTVIFIILLFVIVTLFLDWRKGLYFALLAGFLQDPIRKMIEGAPIEMTLLSTVVLSIIYVKINTGRVKGVGILSSYPSLRRPLLFFMFLVVFQSFHAYFNTSSVVIAVIGILAYSAPFPAVIISYRLVRTTSDVKKLLSAYTLMATFMVLTIWLEWYGFEWTTLGTFGKAWFVYYEGGALQMLSGFFRSPEIAAWHGATAASIALSAMSAKGERMNKRNLVFFILCFVTLFLTGRRKGVGVILIFAGLLALYLLWFRVAGRKRLMAAILLSGIVVGGIYFVSAPDAGEMQITPYVLRGKTTFEATPTRMLNVVDNILYTWREAGVLGLGAGYFSQGSQYVAVTEARKAQFTEVGPAKILGELGLFGAMLILWILIALYRVIKKIMTMLISRELRYAAVIILSLLSAHIVNFVFAAQVFGDPFVLTVLGILLGTLMALPNIEEAYGHSPARQRGVDERG